MLNVQQPVVAHQYKIRQRNLKEDLDYIQNSRKLKLPTSISEFGFEYVPKTDIQYCKQIAIFINQNEWLGKMGMYPTHRFSATYQGELAGAVVMDMPNAFNSRILGEEHKLKERLISRGACASWTPKGLASWLIMKSIRWMVQNTDYRIFTAYSDPEAGELGTIYQACNFYYLGDNFGTSKMYFDPQRPERGWFSDRRFRSKEFYKYYREEMPSTYRLAEIMGVEKEFYKLSAKSVKERCQVKDQPSKHKYCYILGRTKKETLALRKLFEERNEILDYPKTRGITTDVSIKLS